MALRIPPQACSGTDRISKRTVIASFEVGSKTRNYLEGLDYDKWSITAFEPENRLVCLDMTSEQGLINHITLDIPVWN